MHFCENEAVTKLDTLRRPKARANVLRGSVAATAAALLLCSGCITRPSVLKELAQDQASWSIHVQTIWGSADYVRLGASTNQQHNPFQ
jgi:hypothetical protein